MRLVFAGTPEFASTALRRLSDAGFEVPLVLTQPDRPAGRGLQLHESPVKLLARERGIALIQPRSLRLDGRFAADAQAAQAAITQARAQLMVVAAYGLMLPPWLLTLMQGPQSGDGLGCINIHASLLPRWRGAAPIHRAIEAGDAETGVSIMQMDAGLDTGDILLAESLPIRHGLVAPDTSASLHDKLAAMGAELIVQALQLAAAAGLRARRQSQAGVTYASKVDKAQAEVDWESSADLVERRVRAFNPAPGAWTMLGDEVFKLWRCERLDAVAGHGTAGGTVLQADARGIDVACGAGVLRLTELQRAGGKRLDVAAFLRGFALPPGLQFGRKCDLA